MLAKNEIELYYNASPIGSLETLAKLLGLKTNKLIELANHANDLYTTKTIIKKNKLRVVHTAKHSLKIIHERIKNRIFCHVRYPDYLQGGIKDIHNPRSHIANARMHEGAKYVINIDISKFFPSLNRRNIKKIWKHFSIFLK